MVTSFQFWVVLVVLALIGSLYIPQPFFDDQALYLVGAETISQGGVLYKDYWDVKQPGIFLFYLAAGRMFGFTEVGIHTFELLWMLTLAIAIMCYIYSEYNDKQLASLAALFTVGMYYAVSGIGQLGQVESLVALPLFLCLAFSLRKRMFLSGLMGFSVLLFKLIFLPIIISFWLYTIVKSNNRLWKVASVACGILIPLQALLFYFYQSHALGLLFYNSCTYPIKAISYLQLAGAGRLILSFQWFLDRFLPLLLLGSISVLLRLFDRLAINLFLWLSTGLLVILAQRTSWWNGHFMLLLVPLGILSAFGVKHLLKLDYKVISAAVLVLFLPSILRVATVGAKEVQYRLCLTHQSRLKFQTDPFLYPDSLYSQVIADTKILPEKVGIYVIGNPLFYYLSGHSQAVSVTGGFDNLVPNEWIRIINETQKNKPSYIFLAGHLIPTVKGNAPRFEDILRTNYTIVSRTETGSWYKKDD